MKKRIVVVLLAGALVMAGLTGCGGRESAEQGKGQSTALEAQNQEKDEDTRAPETGEQKTAGVPKYVFLFI